MAHVKATRERKLLSQRVHVGCLGPKAYFARNPSTLRCHLACLTMLYCAMTKSGMMLGQQKKHDFPGTLSPKP